VLDAFADVFNDAERLKLQRSLSFKEPTTPKPAETRQMEQGVQPPGIGDRSQRKKRSKKKSKQKAFF